MTSEEKNLPHSGVPLRTNALPPRGGWGEKDHMQELFEAIRESCSRATWSRGVELARAGAVLGERAGNDQVICRVTTPAEKVARTVVLAVDDEDWSCDCHVADDVCIHVAAAAIAMRRANEAGEALPAPKVSVARVGYRLERTTAGLGIDRVLVKDGSEAPLATSLAAITSGRVEGPQILTTPVDLAFEVALGTKRRGWFPREVMHALLETLAGADDVRLDGTPVRVAKARVGMVAVVEDQGDGFFLRMEKDPAIREIFPNGIARCDGDVIRPFGEPPLTARELAELRNGRPFPASQLVELVTRVVPSLQERIDVHIRSKRFPRTSKQRLRMLVQTEQKGDALVVFPTVVYGDPPVARVDGGNLTLLGDDPVIPLRNEEAEGRLVRQLQSDLGLAPGKKALFRGEEAVAMADRVRSFSGDVDGKGLENFFLAPRLVPQLAVNGNAFDVSFTTAGGGRDRADAAAVLRAWQDGSAFAPLIGGGIAPIPTDWLEKFGNRIADLLAARDGSGELPACAIPDLARLCDDLDQPPPPQFDRLRPLLEDFSGLPSPAYPQDLRAELRAYQKQGVAWLSFLQEAGLGALLADDMGLGKTLQTISTIRGRTLVVAPTSVIHNWSNEIARFRPSLRVAVFHGPQRSLDPDADVVLTTYAILRLDTELLAAQKWETVVLDEAQAIKNPDSQVAQAAFQLPARFRVCLSGTPVENRLEELWSQLHFLNRGLLGGRKDFQERYAKAIAGGVPGAAERLRARIKPFVLRRMKREVAPELPPRTDIVLRCTLSESERKVYDAVRASTLQDVVQQLQKGGNVLAALEALLRLRQAACHAGLVPGQRADHSSKVELLLEQLDEAVAEGHKALVFSQWTSLLDRVEPHLKKAGIDFLRLDGSTVDRGGVVDAFQREDGPPVLLLSLKAGGTGLNLTAADHVFLLDPWWNPAVEDQAADRAHRIGQDKPVLVHRLVAEDTVEERILALQDRKRALAEAALGAGDQALALTREDLLGLLE